MATLVIYYSQTGSTELVALTLAKNLWRRVFEVKD